MIQENSNERKKRTPICLNTLETIKSMRHDGDSFKKIARNLNISIITVQKRMKDIEDCQERGIGLETLIKKTGRPVNNISDYATNIMEIIQNDPLVIQKGIKNKLEDLNISISQPTISRNLKKLDITRKRTKMVYQKVTEPRVINERKTYAIKYRKIQNSRLLFIDETGFNLHSIRNYGYSPINTPVNVLVKPRERNLSLMAMISSTGIIHTKIREGSCDSDFLITFLQECIDSNDIMNFRNKIIIMDNVRFHKTEQVREFLSVNNISYDFIPPYSPALNPIEEFFSSVKARYHNKRPLADSNIKIKNHLEEVFDEITERNDLNFEGFYDHMRDHLDLAFNGQFF